MVQFQTEDWQEQLHLKGEYDFIKESKYYWFFQCSETKKIYKPLTLLSFPHVQCFLIFVVFSMK